MILLVRTENHGHGRKRWLSDLPFVLFALAPWVVMIWLLLHRR